ncbi:hypothetical protein AJ79_01394 [Helicocarpus griseus UAMH5409]|uniref:Hyaluronan/mRNA-binding protein domain-containing protein n=1 Tax=Helicocarpus griseus UAMH5409 TaxID=1447875 RepID=A0A2B7Y729_9EURO|nr:hypothetical protein AJ79_01394 [Helicocarpus griseus UAMH5409]
MGSRQPGCKVMCEGISLPNYPASFRRVLCIVPFHLIRFIPLHQRVTRSHKLNDRDHVGLADGTALPEEHLPRYFAKNGHIDADPKKTKKDGGGKGNWGRSGDEMQDYGYKFTNARRRSNSSTQGLSDFKTKFETVEPEVVFEEEMHGPIVDMNGTDVVEKVKSNESSTSGVSEEESEVKKA